MGAPYGGVEEEDGSFKGKSHISFQHALILAADEAHKAHPGANCTVTFEIILGSNPPINEYKAIVTPN